MGYRNYTGPKYDPSGDLALAKGFSDFGKSIAQGITANEKRKQEEEARRLAQEKADRQGIDKSTGLYTKAAGTGKKALGVVNNKSADDAVIVVDIDPFSEEYGKKTREVNTNSGLNMTKEDYTKAKGAMGSMLNTVANSGAIAQQTLNKADQAAAVVDAKGVPGGLSPTAAKKYPELFKTVDQWGNADKITLKGNTQTYGFDAIDDKGNILSEGDFSDLIIPDVDKQISSDKAYQAISTDILNNFTPTSAEAAYYENQGKSNSDVSYRTHTKTGTVVAVPSPEYIKNKLKPTISNAYKDYFTNNPQGLVNYYNDVLTDENTEISVEDMLEDDTVVRNAFENKAVQDFVSKQESNLRTVVRKGYTHYQLNQGLKKGDPDITVAAEKQMNTFMEELFAAHNYKANTEYGSLGTIDQSMKSYVNQPYNGGVIKSVEAKTGVGETTTYIITSEGKSSVVKGVGEDGYASEEYDTLKPGGVTVTELNIRDPKSVANFYIGLGGEVKGKDDVGLHQFAKAAALNWMKENGEDVAKYEEEMAKGSYIADMLVDKKDKSIKTTGVGEAVIDIPKLGPLQAELDKKQSN